MKYIIHVDINSFFASVEELQNPNYKNKPIVVSGYTKRSVVASANYIARNYGINAAMPIFMAKNLCRSLVVVTPHFNLYEEYSEKFIRLISEKFTNNIEIGSIDECYVDITNIVNKKNQPINIAYQIQKMIKAKLGLNCSIGIANNKFLAKMGSDYKKPLGITTIWKNEIPNKLWPQSIDNMLWIGKASADLLKKHGIYRIGDIANEKNKKVLEKLLDKNWLVHYQHANGGGSDTLDYSKSFPKSIGNSETFLNDTCDFDEIKDKIVELTHSVVRQLKYHRLQTKTISLKVKTPDFKQYNKSLTIEHYIDNYNLIIGIVMRLFQENFSQTTLRLIGVTLSSLVQNKELKISSELFDDYRNNDENFNKVSEREIAEKINKKFAKDIITIAEDKLK